MSTDLQFFEFQLDVSWCPHAFVVYYWQGGVHLHKETQVNAVVVDALVCLHC